jgi:hypothetical protein
VTELAQFAEVGEATESATDLDSINAVLTGATAPAGTASTAGTTPATGTSAAAGTTGGTNSAAGTSAS